MPVDNEELLQQLQRASVLARRSRRAHVKGRIEEEGGDGGKCGKKHDGHRKSRNAMAFDDAEAAHGYGNHKCHGGSGRHGQNRILAALVMSDGASQKDLAYILGIRPQSLSEAVEKLEKSELIMRKHSEVDARVMNVFLTDAGRERAFKVAEDRKKNAADIFADLSEEEKEQFSAIMTKVIGKLDNELGKKNTD